MRPLTDHIPKPMVSVNGRPIIAYIMDMVLDYGIDNIIVNIHYKPETLIEYLHTYYPNKVTFSDETDRLLDSGGGVIKALPHIQEENFFVINADCIWHDLNNNVLSEMEKSFDKEKMDILKCLYPSKQAIGFDEEDIYSLDSQGRILQKTDKPSYSFTGIQLMSQKIATGFRPIKFSMREIWQKAFNEMTVYGHVFKGQWLHIGTPESVYDAQEYLKRVN